MLIIGLLALSVSVVLYMFEDLVERITDRDKKVKIEPITKKHKKDFYLLTD